MWPTMYSRMVSLYQSCHICMKMRTAMSTVDNQLYAHHQCLPWQTPDTVTRVNGVGQQGAQTQRSAADVAAPGQPRYMRRHTALHSRSGLTARWHEQVI